MFDAAIYAHDLRSMQELFPREAAGVFEIQRLAVGVSDPQDLTALLTNLGEYWYCQHELVGLKRGARVLLHELLHSVGPEDGALMVSDSYGYQRPSGRFFCEGLNDLATDLFLDDFLVATGLAEKEPELLRIEVSPFYPKELRVVRVLTAHVAERLGVDHKDLVRELAREGYSDRPRALLHNKLMQKFIDGRADPTIRGRIGRNLGYVIENAMTGDIGTDKIAARIDGALDLSRHQGPLASAQSHPTLAETRRLPVPILVARDGKIVRPKLGPRAAERLEKLLSL